LAILNKYNERFVLLNLGNDRLDLRFIVWIKSSQGLLIAFSSVGSLRNC